MSAGKHPAEVLADRLESDDPEFDDCADAGDMLRTIPELEAEIEGLTSTVIQVPVRVSSVTLAAGRGYSVTWTAGSFSESA